MNKMYLNLGDPSSDGHGRGDKVLIETNKTARQMRTAYKKSCKLTGISFNHGEDFTETNREWGEAGKYQICTNFEVSRLTPECVEVLKANDCPLTEIFGGEELEDEDDNWYVDEEIFTALWMWFVGLSMKSFKWQLPNEKEKTPIINCYGKLNVQFGYGLYG